MLPLSLIRFKSTPPWNSKIQHCRSAGLRSRLLVQAAEAAQRNYAFLDFMLDPTTCIIDAIHYNVMNNCTKLGTRLVCRQSENWVNAGCAWYLQNLMAHIMNRLLGNELSSRRWLCWEEDCPLYCTNVF